MSDRDLVVQTSANLRLRVGRRRLSLPEDCARTLTEAIQDRTLAPGTRLPSEADLAAQLDVSRATLREALRTLEERQLVVRRHGLGTFVAESTIEKNLHRNSSITAMIRAAGYSPGTGNQRVDLIEANREVADLLELEEGAPVVRLERLRLADKRPVVLSSEMISGRLVDPHDISSMDEDHQSLYRLLFKLHGIVISRAQADITPVKATREMAAQLEVPRLAPLLCLKQVDFDGSGKPILYSIGYHVSNWVRFTVERLGPGIAAADE